MCAIEKSGGHAVSGGSKITSLTVPTAFDGIRRMKSSAQNLLWPAADILLFAGIFPRVIMIVAGMAMLVPTTTAAEPAPEEIQKIVEQLRGPNGARLLIEKAKAKQFRDLAYVEAGHERQKLDLYVPEVGSEMPPLVVFIHGGGWRSGRKGASPALPLLARGYAVAGLGYRLSDAAQFPAQIHDCKAAIRWLRANAQKYGFNPDKIGVWGPSAGGHLSALLGTSGEVRELEGDLGNAGVSSRVQAVCDFYGPTDFLLGDVGGKADNAQGPVALLLGGPVPQRPEVARAASPAHWISRDDPPFLIFQGGKDRTVPPVQSQKFAELLKQAGVEVELVEFPEAEHGGPAFSSPETIGKIVDFFDRHLKR
jgi:acetyl esterase/lipase